MVRTLSNLAANEASIHTISVPSVDSHSLAQIIADIAIPKHLTM